MLRARVQLIGVRIDRPRDCSGGRFENPRGIAIGVHSLRANIQGSVFLRNGFHATGAVQLVRITNWWTVGRHKRRACRNVTADTDAATTLVRKTFCGYGGPHLEISGELHDLRSARVRVLNDDRCQCLSPGVSPLVLDGFVYERNCPGLSARRQDPPTVARLDRDPDTTRSPSINSRPCSGAMRSGPGRRGMY